MKNVSIQGSALFLFLFFFYSFSSCFIFLIYFELKDNYSTVLVSAIQPHGSATGTLTSPPPTPSHPSRLSQSPSLSSLSHKQIPTGYLFYIW